MRELSIDDLDHITGGEIEGPEDVEYNATEVIRDGNLYNMSNMKEVVGSIHIGQKVKINPYFSYIIDGTLVCAIEVNGSVYITERDNVA